MGLSSGLRVETWITRDLTRGGPPGRIRFLIGKVSQGSVRCGGLHPGLFSDSPYGRTPGLFRPG
jgi:hypothetical protein